MWKRQYLVWQRQAISIQIFLQPGPSRTWFQKYFHVGLIAIKSLFLCPADIAQEQKNWSKPKKKKMLFLYEMVTKSHNCTEKGKNVGTYKEVSAIYL